jgi:uncharacterized membrane protein YhaH (DUF805 family)
VNFLQAIVSGLRNGANFRDRSSRSEFWSWVLFTLILQVIAAILDVIIFPESDSEILERIVSLGLAIPSLAVEIRRLHDVDRSGWWILAYFTIIGGLYPLLYWKIEKGTDGPNRFGEDPFGIAYKNVFE